MRNAPLAVALMLLPLVAGCVAPDEDETPAAVQVDSITPGEWVVRGGTDYLLLWAHNTGSQNVDVQWDLALPGASDGLTFRFDPPNTTLLPAGSKRQEAAGGGRMVWTYPDWGWTLARMDVPADHAGGRIDADVVAESTRAPLTIKIEADRGEVSKPRDHVELDYSGSFTDSGEEFDSGQFGTTLGSGETVTGFDRGLMGLAIHEPARLVIPPALGYGYDQTHPSYTRFNGEWLTFNVEILSIST